MGLSLLCVGARSPWGVWGIVSLGASGGLSGILCSSELLSSIIWGTVRTGGVLGFLPIVARCDALWVELFKGGFSVCRCLSLSLLPLWWESDANREYPPVASALCLSCLMSGGAGAALELWHGWTVAAACSALLLVVVSYWASNLIRWARCDGADLSGSSSAFRGAGVAAITLSVGESCKVVPHSGCTMANSW